ncbi:MAG TPA: TetR/AcrR family transcriptional regulator [Solirubrobacteraceae bacterium]|nr:TetR/AcrR family transcriptional regulator [Solirubrobacteraceae bacterium]
MSRLTRHDDPARDGSAFTRDHVDEIQRLRVLGALREVVSADGVGTATVAQIVARAGVSRRTFYELFADRDACLLAALDEAVARAAGRVVPPFRAPGRWSERVRASLQELLALFDDQPELGALCVVHALGAGPVALRRRAVILHALAGAIDEGRAERRGTREPAPLVAEGVVGAVLAVLHSRLSGEQPTHEPLSALLGQLMSMIVLPYLGPAAAARELTRPAPKAHSPRRRGTPEDPLRGLDMRLTYRTVRVLLAIASLPDASNRDVANVAGIVDQGQTSKLLQRLQHLGLVDNAAQGCFRRGEPNAWRLTQRGEQLLATIDGRAVAVED